MKLRLWEAGQATKELVIDKQLVRLGRDPRCEVVFDPAVYPKVSGLHAQLQLDGNELKLTPLSKSNQTLLNDSPIDGVQALKPGDRIRLGFTGPTIELVNLKHTTLAKPVAPRHTENKDAVNDEDVPAATVMAGKVSDYLPHSGGIEEFEIGRGGIIGRDVKHATFVLDHSQVSRVHARLTVTKGSVTLADLGSSNGTFCNGVQVTNARVLAPATPLISALSDWSLTANHLKVGRALATFNLPFQMSALQ